MRAACSGGLRYLSRAGNSESSCVAKFERITSNPAVLNGQPTIRGMRLSIRRVIETLVLYPNWDDLRAEYPELEPEDIRQALALAARNLDDSIVQFETA